MLNTVFQIVVIVWGIVSVLLVFGLGIAAMVIMRKTQAATHRLKDRVTSPLEKAKEGMAFVRGAAKGTADAANIMRGKEVRHEDGHRQPGSENKR